MYKYNASMIPYEAIKFYFLPDKVNVWFNSLIFSLDPVLGIDWMKVNSYTID